MMQSVILVFDIGKTNKKVIVFDLQYRVLEEHTQTFAEVPDFDGFAGDDLRAIAAWFLQQLKSYLHSNVYAVTAVNFSAYGASLVHLDQKGDWLEPFFNYLKPLPADLGQRFNDQYNSHGNLFLETACPYLGMLNSGLQLFIQ